MALAALSDMNALVECAEWKQWQKVEERERKENDINARWQYVCISTSTQINENNVFLEH